MNIVNPRIKTQDTWYSYYAGFSTDFVNSVISKYDMSNDDLILDPWNGSGTTTTVAYERGIHAIGIDINPAIIAIAKSRLLRNISLNQVLKQCDEIVQVARYRIQESLDHDDMLLLWFSNEPAQIIRNIARSISDNFGIRSGLQLEELTDERGCLASFFYVALFCTAKHYLSESKSKNPTWTKTIKVESLDMDNFFSVYRAYLEKNINAIPRCSELQDHKSKIIIEKGSSTSIQIHDCTVDYIVTSPPYCTRIDYAVTTKVELAILGLSSPSFRILRDMMIGTTTVHCKEFPINREWGLEVKSLLSAINSHPSYASSSYYYKTYWQYFSSSYDSFCELNRVLKEDGHAIIVVQDSFYKELHVDLSKIFIEMASNLGWECEDLMHFKKMQSLSSINSKSHPNGQSSKRIETVLMFRKRGKNDRLESY